MANELKKGGLFLKEVLNRLKGDDSEAKAAKIARKALSSVEGQIASLNSKKVDQENELEDAEEALSNAQYPTEVFVSNQTYVDSILRAQKQVDEAKDNLEATNKAIEYFKGLLEGF